MLQENKHTWGNVVIYKCITTISAFRLANSVSIYPQHFACQPQINWWTFIINCTQNNVIGHTNTSVLMNYFVLDPSCFVMTTKQGGTEKPYKRTIQTNHNFACLQLSTLSPKLIQGKFFLALTSAKEKKCIFLLFLSLRTIIIFYRQMQKLYMNTANHSGPNLFFAHLWYCAHHWCGLSRNKVNTVLSSNKVPVIRSLKLLYWLSWARKISQLLWLSSKKKE